MIIALNADDHIIPCRRGNIGYAAPTMVTEITGDTSFDHPFSMPSISRMQAHADAHHPTQGHVRPHIHAHAYDCDYKCDYGYEDAHGMACMIPDAPLSAEFTILSVLQHVLLLLPAMFFMRLKFRKITPRVAGCSPSRWARELKCEARRRKVRQCRAAAAATAQRCTTRGQEQPCSFFRSKLSCGCSDCPIDAVVTMLCMPPPLPLRRRRGAAKCTFPQDGNCFCKNSTPSITSDKNPEEEGATWPCSILNFIFLRVKPRRFLRHKPGGANQIRICAGSSTGAHTNTSPHHRDNYATGISAGTVEWDPPPPKSKERSTSAASQNRSANDEANSRTTHPCNIINNNNNSLSSTINTMLQLINPNSVPLALRGASLFLATAATSKVRPRDDSTTTKPGEEQNETSENLPPITHRDKHDQQRRSHRRRHRQHQDGDSKATNRIRKTTTTNTSTSTSSKSNRKSGSKDGHRRRRHDNDHDQHHRSTRRHRHNRRLKTTAPPQTSLLDMARMQQWDAIQQYGTRSAAKQVDADGLHPLHWACSGGPPVQAVNTLLKLYRKAAYRVDSEGSTPLHFACHYGASAAVVEALLRENPAAVGMQDRYGRTPLHHAISKGARMDVVETLAQANPQTVLISCHASKTRTYARQQHQEQKQKPIITPLYIAWMEILREYQTTQRRSGKKWDKAILLLQVAFFHLLSLDDNVENRTRFSLLPAAITMLKYLPLPAFRLAVEHALSTTDFGNDPFSGFHPMVLAAKATEPTACDQVLGILSQAIQRNGAVISNEVVTQAVAACLRSGKHWDQGVERLFGLSPECLHSIDPNSGLPLAILAAATPKTTRGTSPQSRNIRATATAAGTSNDHGTSIVDDSDIPQRVRNHKLFSWRQNLLQSAAARSQGKADADTTKHDDGGVAHASVIYNLLRRNPAAIRA